MISVQKLSAEIEALNHAGSVDMDEFEEWFLSETWGYYEARQCPLSDAIAAVHHVLHSYQRDELIESNVARALAAAIRPFERRRASAVVSFQSLVRFEPCSFEPYKGAASYIESSEEEVPSQIPVGSTKRDFVYAVA